MYCIKKQCFVQALFVRFFQKYFLRIFCDIPIFLKKHL